MSYYDPVIEHLGSALDSLHDAASILDESDEIARADELSAIYDQVHAMYKDMRSRVRKVSRVR